MQSRGLLCEERRKECLTSFSIPSASLSFRNIRMLGWSAPLIFYKLHPKSVIGSSCVYIKHRAFKIDAIMKVLVIDKK